MLYNKSFCRRRTPCIAGSLSSVPCQHMGASVRQPPRNNKFKLFHKDQRRKSKKCKAVPLAEKGTAQKQLEMLA